MAQIRSHTTSTTVLLHSVNRTAFASVSRSLGPVSQAAAFTLVELTLTLTLVAILSVVAVPKFLSLLQLSTDSYVLEIKSSLRYANKVAVGMGCDVQASIVDNALHLNLRTGCSTGAFTQALPSPGANLASYSRPAPSQVILSASAFPVYFDARGRCIQVASNTVTDAVVMVNTRLLQIVGETGFTYEP